MPVELLTDARVAAYRCVGGETTLRPGVERSFCLVDGDRILIVRARSDHRRLGIVVGLGTV
jgi:hypothetical protein